MLAVTTFSLATMVTVYSSASRIATPRATQLLVEDRTSQNVLSTFVGAFAFSLVGIIALSTGYYSEQGRTLLFLGTLVVILLIVVTLLRWIAYLADFGRMADIIDRVEKAARETLTAYAERPAMGARMQRQTPAAGIPVFAAEPGYVTHIDLAALERVGDAANVDVHVAATPGRVADARTPLARVIGALDDDGTRVDPARVPRGGPSQLRSGSAARRDRPVGDRQSRTVAVDERSGNGHRGARRPGARVHRDARSGGRR